MVTDVDGNEIRPGARVRVVTSGEVTEVVGDPNESQVHLRGGDSAHPKKLKVMSATLDEVDHARTARCTYCRHAVAMQSRTLEHHRTSGGICPGAGRRVAALDHYGQAIFEAPQQAFARDVDGQEIRVGDRLQPTHPPGWAQPVVEVTRVEPDRVWFRGGSSGAGDWDSRDLQMYRVKKV